MSEIKASVLRKILTELIPVWEPAKWFLLLLNEMEKDERSSNLVEKLYQQILQNIRAIKSKDQQDQINTAIQKLKERSELATQEDQEEAEQILDDLFIDNI